MAGEERVIGRLVELLGEFAPALVPSIEALWFDEGAPAQPSDGAAGRLQLAIAARELRRVGREASALARLAYLHADDQTVSFLAQPPRDLSLDPVRQPLVLEVGAGPALDDWVERVTRTADAIEEFVLSDDGG